MAEGGTQRDDLAATHFVQSCHHQTPAEVCVCQWQVGLVMHVCLFGEGGGREGPAGRQRLTAARTVHEADCCEEPQQGPLADRVQQDPWQLGPAGPDTCGICGCGRPMDLQQATHTTHRYRFC